MNTYRTIDIRKLILINVGVLLLVAAIALSGIWLPRKTESAAPAGSAFTNAPASDSAIPAVMGENPTGLMQGIESLQNLQNAYRSVAAAVLPSIVEIDVVDIVDAPSSGSGSPFEYFFGPRGNQGQTPPFRQQGLGSGVIVRQDGDKVYVLSNDHVVGEADEISVKLNDGQRFEAQLVGADPKKDLALVVFESEKRLPIAALGNSDSLMVGDLVLAVGSPLGFESTVTSGIVSAVGRRSMSGSVAGGFTDYIQTDAAINQGNSGGALVNIYGQVVGINTWIASSSGGNVGLGFAIPVNNARKAIDDFITKGRSEYGWLGISMGGAPLPALEDLQLEDASGAFVYGVFAKSPANKAGILPGDFITDVNGASVEDSSDLLMAVGNLQPGSTVDFGLIRQGEPLKLSAKITVREDDAVADSSAKLWPGFSLVPVTEELQAQMNLDSESGNLVIASVEQEGPAQIAGLREGDIIQKVNNEEVSSLMEFYRAFNDSRSKEILFHILRDDTPLVIGLVR
jgi:serine protease Do